MLVSVLLWYKRGIDNVLISCAFLMLLLKNSNVSVLCCRTSQKCENSIYDFLYYLQFSVSAKTNKQNCLHLIRCVGLCMALKQVKYGLLKAKFTFFLFPHLLRKLECFFFFFKENIQIAVLTCKPAESHSKNSSYRSFIASHRWSAVTPNFPFKLSLWMSG